MGDEDKQFDATPRKLQQARKEGQVVKSKDFSTAISLRRTLASIRAPCSVKAKGKEDFGRLALDVITNCDEITSHSVGERRNIKSSGKRSILRFTA